MKNTHFLTYLSALFLLCGLTSCHYEKVFTYTLRNESGVPVKINAQSRDDKPKKIISLNHEEEITEEYISRNPREFYDLDGYFNRPLFLEVIYKNEKKEVFITPHLIDHPMASHVDSLEAYIDTLRVLSDKNPLNTYFYQGQEVTFLFTEEDYENATDCGGDCE